MNMSDKDCENNYEMKCDCAEDDNCGCTFPNNTSYNYNYAEKRTTFKKKHKRPTVGMTAPDFTAPAILPDNTLDKSFNFYKYTPTATTILFFYPEDFSFTCPSELLMLNQEINSFTLRNTQIIGISTDSIYSHLAWKQIPIEKDGIPDIKFPLVSDMDKKISMQYGFITKKGNNTRSTVIIDSHKKIRHISTNDNKIWRNPAEYLRIIEIINQKGDGFTNCPRGWKQNFFFERPQAEPLTEMFNPRD